jgi:hypothetical protein
MKSIMVFAEPACCESGCAVIFMLTLDDKKARMPEAIAAGTQQPRQQDDGSAASLVVPRS